MESQLKYSTPYLHVLVHVLHAQVLLTYVLHVMFHLTIHSTILLIILVWRAVHLEHSLLTMSAILAMKLAKLVTLIKQITVSRVSLAKYLRMDSASTLETVGRMQLRLQGNAKIQTIAQQ